MRFKSRVDEPLIVFLGQRAYGCDTSGLVRSRGLRGRRVLRRAGVYMCGERRGHGYGRGCREGVGVNF